MGKILKSVEEVKNLLEIDSFRNITKEKVIEFVSQIPNMDKEVAINIINQFPSYVKLSETMIVQLKNLCSDALTQNNKSNEASINAYSKILDDLGILLHKEELTFEEKKYITEQMVSIADKISAKDTENKKFINNKIGYVSMAFMAVVGVGVLILGGGNISIDDNHI
ncbi:hypothetical protein [Anaerococcus jeddahensis]|uniref:hypothetical protein n=1 Tax=Anaerococcus jeddahensis TaxID=1673719 RepID=UPI00067267D5|nr:hypothetical protein [Anaerococcus jeddahensis]